MLQNEPPDLGAEFGDQRNHFFIADEATRFDPASGAGELRWRRMALRQRVSYHQVTLQLEDYAVWEDVPPHEYEDDRHFPFRVSFVSPRTARLRVAARPADLDGEGASPMVERVPADDSWAMSEEEGGVRYRSAAAELVVRRDPWRVELRAAGGRLLTRTNHISDSLSVVNTHPIPFSYARRSADMRRNVAASLALSPAERLYGGGESFTRLDKRGQELRLWTSDAYGAQTPRMYKPVPFVLSSAGWAAFVHTGAPVSLDLGHGYDGAAVLYLDDDELDLFLFAGTPAEVVSEYTALTGRSPVPPLWSFGLTMGRTSYESADEVRAVARGLRERRVPCDAIHVDTHWTEVPFRSDYRFSPSRFPDPEALTAELAEQGLRLTVWQFPYLHPADPLHTEAIAKGYVVLSANGKPPIDDAVLDLSNAEAVRWYAEKLERVLRQGVAAFVSDFGEAAPLAGLYAGDRSAYREHNLYPLRYNRAVAEATEAVTGARVQFARSAWAGSQRYPLHFGGDAENTDGAMAASLRACLSLGLCGFSFWTQFIGGFPNPPDPRLYRRWLAFGLLVSHPRCHGKPPREPWEFGAEFLDDFRRAVELRYSLIPYVYAQAHECAARGHPMVRPLFFDRPDDRTSWLVEDEYLFGADLLVAPMFEKSEGREVYLPPGAWLDYFSGEEHRGPGWKRLRHGPLPVVLLVRDGAAVPRAAPAQCTDAIDWERLELAVFAVDAVGAEGAVARPGDGGARRVRLERGAEGFTIAEDPFGGAVEWTLSS